MRRMYPLGLALIILIAASMTASGQLSSYYFAQSTGEPTAMDGSTILFQGSPGNNRDNNIFNIPIGFNFRFNGSLYSTASLSTNGVIYLGTVAPYDPNNSIPAAPSYPLLAPFWDNLRFGGGTQGCYTPRLHYVVKGTAPNRVLTVEFDEIMTYWPGYQLGWLPLSTFQVRLYETSNKIEYWYGAMKTCDGCYGGTTVCFATSASIGIAASGSQFVSVSFSSDGTPQENRATPNDNVNINGNVVKPNTLIVFGECVAALNGRVGQDNGGTATMNNGDTFFTGFNTQVGQSSVYRPFDIRMISTVCSGSYTLTITGPAATDYYFGTPGTQTLTRALGAGGDTHVPEFTFKPTNAGLRQATLTVTSSGLTRTFNLAAYAPFVNYIGHVAQGGTPLMTSGDVILAGKVVPRRTNANFTPFTLQNVSNVSVPVTYTITGADGQYTISPGGSLAPGATVTPVINFNALGFGAVPAQLRVDAGPENRTFTLRAISAAPGGEFRLGAKMLDTSSALFTNSYVCVGSQVQALRVDMVNTGYGTFRIDGAVFYEVDTLIQQGIPRYAYRRDRNGNLIPARDYVISLEPPPPHYAPKPGNSVFPILLAEGQTQTIYVSFIGTASGKRFARGFIYTNSENTAAADTLGVVREGIVAFDVFGRGSGARLADAITGGLPKAIVFPGAKLNSTVQATLKLSNPGTCDLYISMDKLQVTAGDVDEFSIISLPQGNINDNNDLVLEPGESDEIVLGFKPLQAGSRRASLRLATNDSTIHLPGVSERGAYYIDLYGSGGTDMYTQGANFPQTLIDGPPAEHRHDVVRIINTMSVNITVNSIAIEGTDQGDFTADAANPWPATPYVLKSGEEMVLGVKFAPQGGQPGERTANVKLLASQNLEGLAPLTGIAGTRTMETSPTAIAFAGMSTGKQQRRMVKITNTGTMPMTITMPEVTGLDEASFQLGKLERMEIAAGASEFLELTYAPIAPGPMTASLSVGGNATNAPGIVLLSGTAFMPKGPDGNDGHTPVTGIEDGVGRNPNMSTSGVEAEVSIDGTMLYQSKPNPASDQVEISYYLPKAGAVELALYDAQGRLVKMLAEGNRTMGAHETRASVRDLSAGVYHYRLTIGGTTLTRTLHIVR